MLALARSSAWGCPPFLIPSPQKKSPALPTARVWAASQLTNPWCSSGVERACQRLGLALLLMEKHFPTSEQILPTVAGSPKGPCLYLGMSPRAQGSLRQPRSPSLKVSSPHPGCKKPSKGVTRPISSPPLILQEPNSHSKLNLGWGCYLYPFFLECSRCKRHPKLGMLHCIVMLACVSFCTGVHKLHFPLSRSWRVKISARSEH